MYLHNMFDYAITVTGRMNRNVHRLFVPQIHTNYMESVVYVIVDLYCGTLCQQLYTAQ